MSYVNALMDRAAAALRYVLEDEANLIPRATSSCRKVVREALTEIEAARSASSGKWVGCGECDPEFKCHEGRSACIRLPVAPESEEGRGTIGLSFDSIPLHK